MWKSISRTFFLCFITTQICNYEVLPVGWHLPLHTDQADTQNESERAQLMVCINLMFGRALHMFAKWFVWLTSVSLVESLACSSMPTEQSSFLFLKRLFTHWAPLSRTVCKHTFFCIWLPNRNVFVFVHNCCMLVAVFCASSFIVLPAFTHDFNIDPR